MTVSLLLDRTHDFTPALPAPRGHRPLENIARSAPWYPEEELLARLVEGDRVASREFVELHQASMVKLAMVFVSDRAVAEEVVQETWMGFFRGLEKFQRRASLKTWLFRILTNRARTRGRRDARMVAFSCLGEDQEMVDRLIEDRGGDHPWAFAAAEAHTNPERALRCDQARRRLLEAMEQLPTNQRAVLVMRDMEGAEFREVCEALDISPANQRVLLHRGRVRLRGMLDDLHAGV